MPVDGGMIPLAQPLLPWRPRRKCMIDGGCYVARQHAEEIQNDACRSPAVACPAAPHKEDGAYKKPQDDACTMRPGVPQFFFMREIYLHKFIIL